MPAYRAVAGPGGPEREVHRHTFVGVDVSLLPEDEFPGYTQMRDLAAALLAESAELSAAVDPDARTLEVKIRNLAGHTLPSGATADREMWLEVIIRDGEGKVVFESGTLDERGDLRVEDPSHTTRPGTDPQLVLYGQKMYFDPSLEDPPSDEPRRRVEFLWAPKKAAWCRWGASTSRPTISAHCRPATTPRTSGCSSGVSRRISCGCSKKRAAWTPR
jgi:hypothetical protein